MMSMNFLHHNTSVVTFTIRDYDTLYSVQCASFLQKPSCSASLNDDASVPSLSIFACGQHKNFCARLTLSTFYPVKKDESENTKNAIFSSHLIVFSWKIVSAYIFMSMQHCGKCPACLEPWCSNNTSMVCVGLLHEYFHFWHCLPVWPNNKVGCEKHAMAKCRPPPQP